MLDLIFFKIVLKTLHTQDNVEEKYYVNKIIFGKYLRYWTKQAR